MAFSANESLDTLIVKATNPLVASPDPDIVIEISNRINEECEAAQVATKFIAYRMHSPQEKEALNALLLLQQCVKSCGKSFHAEIGKFRFLNEMIKLVSPKYEGHRTAVTIKEKVLELLYMWTIELNDQPKILEAYDMLKKQGVVKEDPNITVVSQHQPPPPRPKSAVFEDSEKEATLQRLLRSKNPEDLKEANRLIKTMVKEDERRQELAVRRRLELDTVYSNVKLLNELLDNVQANGATPEEIELCQELAANCQKLQSSLSRLASETDDAEPVFGDILKASEDLEKVLDRSSLLKNPAGLKRVENPGPSLLLDLSSPPAGLSKESPLCVLDDPLLSLSVPTPVALAPSLLQPEKVDNQNSTQGAESSMSRLQESKETKGRPRGLDELDLLSETLLRQNLPASAKHASSFHQVAEKVPLNILAKKPEASQPVKNQFPVGAAPLIVPPSAASLTLNSLDLDSLAQGLLSSAAPPAPAEIKTDKNDASLIDGILSLEPPSVSAQNGSAAALLDDVPILQTSPVNSNPSPVPAPSTSAQIPALGEISVKFEDIKPGTAAPVNLLSQSDGLNVVLHSARADVPESVSVFVISTTSRFSSPVSSYAFQAIVPKTCRVKMQPPSGATLPAFNPFLPPAAITQIMLIAFPATVKEIDLKFVISCEVNHETVSEFGEISLAL